MSEYFLDPASCLEQLRSRLGEAAPARIQLVVGPRQVGKTTLLLGLLDELGDRALYLAGDSPEAAAPGAWERLWSDAENVAKERGGAVVLLDEAHHIDRWAERMKGEWDRLRRKRIPVNVVATGSSALHLGTGSRESLAGRFEKLFISHWSAAAIAARFHVPELEAAELLVRMGSYPGALQYRSDLRRWAAYVRDAILEPAIGRDILALAPVRRPALLRQVFALAAAHPAEIVSLQKLQGQLQDKGALETLAHYLTLLREAWLIAPIEKWSDRAIRRRAAPPKLVTLNNALVAVSDPRGVASPTDGERWGRWVENACIAHAWNSGQRVHYWREEPNEVDAIVEGSWGRIALEVKTGAFTMQDLGGLLEFTRRNPAFRPIVACDPGREVVAQRVAVEAVPWPTLLLQGPPPRER
jgi:predicted AAA+ superfamily ATPase